MPQDLSLYGEFTVKESLLYFGAVYGMTPDEIDGKMTFILELLDLPPSSRRISQLRYRT
jgi:ABC-type multidrug transport system ATPase subunit